MLKKKKVQLRDIKSKQASEGSSSETKFKTFAPAILSFTMLIVGISFDYFNVFPFFQGWIRVAWYIVAYIPVGLPVIREGRESIIKGDFFTEFFLMSIATLGAFAIGEYPEGVAVMLFYAVGELFQNAAVRRAKGNIRPCSMYGPIQLWYIGITIL